MVKLGKKFGLFNLEIIHLIVKFNIFIIRVVKVDVINNIFIVTQNGGDVYYSPSTR